MPRDSRPVCIAVQSSIMMKAYGAKQQQGTAALTPAQLNKTVQHVKVQHERAKLGASHPLLKTVHAAQVK